MKRFLAFLISVVGLATGCSSQMRHEPLIKVEKKDEETNLWVEYYAYKGPNGDEIRQGLFLIKYNSGSKYIEAHYKAGLLDGRCFIFSEEGKIEVSGLYKNGKPWDGEFQVGHEIVKYADGKLIGVRND